MTHAKVDYIAEITGPEVTLVGEAELEQWSSLFEKERFHPEERGGSAEISISSVSSRYKGIGFSEIALSHLRADADGLIGACVDRCHESRQVGWVV